MDVFLTQAVSSQCGAAMGKSTKMPRAQKVRTVGAEKSPNTLITRTGADGWRREAEQPAAGALPGGNQQAHFRPHDRLQAPARHHR